MDGVSEELNYFNLFEDRTYILPETEYKARLHSDPSAINHISNAPAFVEFIILNGDALNWQVPNAIKDTAFYINGDFYNWDKNMIQCAKMHEYWELFYASKPGYRAKKRDFLMINPYVPINIKNTAHDLAHIKELNTAQHLGILDEYMEFQITKRKEISNIANTDPLSLLTDHIYFLYDFIYPYKRVTGQNYELSYKYRFVNIFLNAYLPSQRKTSKPKPLI